MIRKEEMIEIAKAKGLAPKLAEMDYLQDISLAAIYREFGNRIIFKGGTCLYKAFQLDRFSEDLDFTVAKGFREKEFFSRLPHFLGLFGIKSSAKAERFDNRINACVRINGPLYSGSRESQAAVLFNISLSERVLLPVVRCQYSPFYPDIRPFDMFAMAEREILAEKIRAVFERNKARDVYDIWHLLARRGEKFDGALARKKLSHSGFEFSPEAFLRKIDEKKESWEKDLGPLVSRKLPSFQEARKGIAEKMGFS